MNNKTMAKTKQTSPKQWRGHKSKSLGKRSKKNIKTGTSPKMTAAIRARAEAAKVAKARQDAIQARFIAQGGNPSPETLKKNNISSGKSPYKSPSKKDSPSLDTVDLTRVKTPKRKDQPKKKPAPTKRRKKNKNPDGPLTYDKNGKPNNCPPGKSGVSACQVEYERKPQCRWRPGHKPAVV